MDECNKAETLVGPALANTNHGLKPIKADLAEAANIIYYLLSLMINLQRWLFLISKLL